GKCSRRLATAAAMNSSASWRAIGNRATRDGRGRAAVCLFGPGGTADPELVAHQCIGDVQGSPAGAAGWVAGSRDLSGDHQPAGVEPVHVTAACELLAGLEAIIGFDGHRGRMIAKT